MADSMRVTSVIGAAPRGRDPRRGALSRARSGARNPGPPRASYLLSQQLLIALRETADEYTTRLAPSPGLLRHPAGHRAVAGPALRRRRAAPRPPVRRTHRAH